MDKNRVKGYKTPLSPPASAIAVMTSQTETDMQRDFYAASAISQVGRHRLVAASDSSKRTSCRLSGQRTAATVFVAVITLLLTALRPSEAIEWLGLANDKRQLTWNQTAGADCARTKVLGLIRDQRLICQRNPDLMPAVAQAARDAVDICQELFADRRWNCSSVAMAPNYLPDLSSNSREQAFVQALSSAALVHAISKACSAGHSSKCGCGPIPNDPPPTPPPGNGINGVPGSGAGQFKWGGCADDLRFGLVFGKWFTDTPTSNTRKISRRAVINSHNNAVGRKVIADSLSTHCKCHGVSGSCTVKTCYRALPVDLRPTVGAVLKSRYAVAIHVDSRNSVPGAGPAGLPPPPPPPPSALKMPSSHRSRGTSFQTSTPSGNGRSKSSSRRKSVSSGQQQQQSTRSRSGNAQSTTEDQPDWLGHHHHQQQQQQQHQGSSRTGRMASVQARSSIDRVEAMLANKSVRDDDLIYYTISPDYCLPDAALGSLGTKDRLKKSMSPSMYCMQSSLSSAANDRTFSSSTSHLIPSQPPAPVPRELRLLEDTQRACDKDSSGSGGCRTMCCGRGYKTETVEVRQRCDCKYYWCCYVKCKTCTKVIEVHRCR